MPKAAVWKLSDGMESTVRTRLRQIVLLTMVSLFILSYASAQTADMCSATRLPGAASELLKTKFPLWRAKQISDLEGYDRQLWLETHPKECPGIAIGHFESSDDLSYAALLVPKTKSSGGYKIVVLSMSQPGNAYSSKILEQGQGQGADGLVISVAAPGQYTDFENTEMAKLKVDGIYVEWIEKGAILYYWSAGQYHKLQTED
jgi:hypothetical protein